MIKKKDLASALLAQDEVGQGINAQETATPLKPIPGDQTKVPTAGGREGMVNIAGWFPQKVKFELEELRLERSRKLGRKITLQQIQAEAYNDLFKKYGHAELAPTTQ